MNNFLQFAGCLTLCLTFGLADASGHEWRFGRTRVEATVEAFDGRVVTFRNFRGRVFRMPVEKLAAEDLGVLRDVVALKGFAGAGAAPAPAAVPAPAAAPAPAAPNRLAAIQAASAQRSTALLERSLAVQNAQYWSQWYDLWVVQFQTRNGQLFWITSPARNSYDAEVAARQRYPAANVIWVKRLSRR